MRALINYGRKPNFGYGMFTHVISLLTQAEGAALGY